MYDGQLTLTQWMACELVKGDGEVVGLQVNCFLHLFEVWSLFLNKQLQCFFINILKKVCNHKMYYIYSYPSLNFLKKIK